MATTRTANLKLRKPAPGDPSWNVPINANADTLDALGPLRNFAVTPATFTAAEAPAGLQFAVAPGDYVGSDGARASVATTATLTALAAGTTCVWLAADGTVTAGADYPAGTRYAPLARVTADDSKITGIVDDRAPTFLLGGGLPFAALSMETTEVEYPATSYDATTSDSVIEVNSGAGEFARNVDVNLPIVVGTRGRIVVVTNANFGTVTVKAAGAIYVVLPWIDSVAWLVFEGDEVWTLLSATPIDQLNVRTQTVSNPTRDYTLLRADFVRVDCTAGPMAVVLPAAANSQFKALTFKKVDATANHATISVESGETIDGATTATLANQYDVIRLVSNGATWDVI